MKIIQETQKFNPIEVKVLVETQEEYDNLLKYIKNYGTKPVSSGNQPDEDGWISNIGNDTYTWPDFYGITDCTVIEVIKRSGKREVGEASTWFATWKETDSDPDDIVKFRILKD
jgi:hypothetical protein